MALMAVPVLNKLTVTEALADIATLGKRIAKRRQGILPYLARQNSETDPITDVKGGSVEFIKQERQAVRDLEERLIKLRMAIQQINQRETITIGTETRTIAEWLTWRKEILPERKRFLQSVNQGLLKLRNEAKSKQVGIVNVDSSQNPSRTDVLVNISESELVAEADLIENVEGTLDGQLSLKNATMVIEI